ncbi:MAG TPA: F0F1 ATP synthase subunit B [Thermoanaerobaculia bacterium]|nr:F0F1 ATP synthase subunit B [Thermoanaerobaculia bacterium]
MKRVLPFLLALLALAALPGLAQHEETGATAARGAATEVHDDAHGEAAAGETHEEKTYFGIPGWILKLLNLILFVGLLVYFIGGPIRGALGERREKIRRDLTEAAERREKADRLAADIQARLDQIEKEVGSILDRAAAEGERQKQEMIAQGHAEAEKILAQAKNAVDAQLRQAKSELTEYAGKLAAERALTILETQMTDADRRKIFAEGVEEIRS